MSPQISIIVCIYNAENTLRKCLNSVKNQSFHDYEVLMINDGSTDDSISICKEFAANDKRFLLLNKSNEGVAKSRALGIRLAKGKYSIHLDSDDWIESSMFEDMYNKIEESQSEMLIVDFYEDIIWKNKSIYRKQQPTNFLSTKIISDILLNRLHGSLWNKLIRHDIYKSFNIKVFENINYCEDVLVCLQILLMKINVVYLGKAYYHYVKSKNISSITTNYTKDSFFEREKYWYKMNELLSSYGIFNREIQEQAIVIKMEALKNNVLSGEEFKSLGFGNKSYIAKSSLSLKNKLCLKLAMSGHVSLAYFIKMFGKRKS